MTRPRLLALLAAALLATAHACDREPPPPSLRTLMFQVQLASNEIAPLLSRPDRYPAVAERAARIAAVAENDAAFARYEARPTYRLPSDELDDFRLFRRQFGERARALEAAARSGDAGGVQRGYAQLQMTCQVCHASFRPGL